MKLFVSLILSLVVFVASFQNSLIFLDYQINRDFYEAHCVNKAKPEMDCHGKCEVKKEAEKTAPQKEMLKISFEFNILPTKNIEIPKADICFSENNNLVFANSTENILKGFHKILPQPPQVLV